MTTPAKLKKLPGAKTRWDEIVSLHQIMALQIHSTGVFLPFHRYFLHVHKALLMECGYKGALPYVSLTLSLSQLLLFSTKSNLKILPVIGTNQGMPESLHLLRSSIRPSALEALAKVRRTAFPMARSPIPRSASDQASPLHLVVSTVPSRMLSALLLAKLRLLQPSTSPHTTRHG